MPHCGPATTIIEKKTFDLTVATSNHNDQVFLDIYEAKTVS